MVRTDLKILVWMAIIGYVVNLLGIVSDSPVIVLLGMLFLIVGLICVFVSILIRREQRR
jgi:hypothetical protein